MISLRAKACGGNVLIRKTDLQKGETCGKAPTKRKWKAYAETKVEPESKEWQAALALAAEANKDLMKTFCYIGITKDQY